MTDAQRIYSALEVARQYGGVEGDHHKAWVIDQMCRALLQEGYESWVKEGKAGADGPETYSWEEGVAP